MKQSALEEENKKYKNITIHSRKISNINKELLVANSIERISNQPKEINKTFSDIAEANCYELYEKVEIATEEIINLFYDMELAILSEGAIPLIMGEKLHALKAVVSLCKMRLCLPGLHEVSFPELFIEEYSLLLERTDKAILAVEMRIDKLQQIEEIHPIKNIIEKNLLTLNMLKMHYVSAIGV